MCRYTLAALPLRLDQVLKIMADKDAASQLREIIRKRRRQIGQGAQHRAAFKLAQQIRDLPEYQNAKRVGLYLASDGEIDCRFIMQDAWRAGKRCYLPVLQTDNPKAHQMDFVHYPPGSPLGHNRYRILEPTSGVKIFTQALDLVLVPLVGFDRQGHRIGMGGGYYDRAFEFTRNPLTANSPVLVGVAHHVQEVLSISPEPWDVPLSTVVSV